MFCKYLISFYIFRNLKYDWYRLWGKLLMVEKSHMDGKDTSEKNYETKLNLSKKTE